MMSRRFIALLALLACAGGLSAAAASQDKGAAKAKVPAPPAPSAEDLAKWKAFGTPGPEHKVLDAKIGKWTTHVRWWMDPAAPPAESDGTCEIKWILGGRYIQESDQGTVMGQPFEGMGLSGYDNLKKKYVGNWVDNMGTGITTSEGTYDAAKKAISYASEGPDNTMTKYVPMRMVDTFVDANTIKMEMYGPDKNGKEYRNMEITYTRAK